MGINVTGRITQKGKTKQSPGQRGIFMGGNAPGETDIMDYVAISTLGNALDFGDLLESSYLSAATSNGATGRGINAGGLGDITIFLNTIERITISTINNAISFGNLTVARRDLGALSNETSDKGIFILGSDSVSTYSNVLDYITISTDSNAQEFAQLSEPSTNIAGTDNGTNDRGIFTIGFTDENGWTNSISYITISSGSAAFAFGDLITLGSNGVSAAVSNRTGDRGAFAGVEQGSLILSMDYVNITSLGVAMDFGDISSSRTGMMGTSNGKHNRAIFGGGHSGKSKVTVIDYKDISTLNNTTAFGDLTAARDRGTATADA